MKKIFLIAAIVSFTFASAQGYKNPFLKTYPEKPKTPYSLQRLQNFNLAAPFQPEMRFLDSLPNGNKVYSLRQDNMPCIVPDMSQYNMPVLKPDVPQTMPNLGYPPQSETKPFSPEKFNEWFQDLKKKGVEFKFK